MQGDLVQDGMTYRKKRMGIQLRRQNMLSIDVGDGYRRRYLFAKRRASRMVIRSQKATGKRMSRSLEE